MHKNDLLETATLQQTACADMTESNSHSGYNKAIYYVKSHMMLGQHTEHHKVIQNNNVGREETENDKFLTPNG